MVACRCLLCYRSRDSLGDSEEQVKKSSTMGLDSLLLTLALCMIQINKLAAKTTPVTRE